MIPGDQHSLEPNTAMPATRFPALLAGRSRLSIPALVSTAWRIAPDTHMRFQITICTEMDGVLKQQSPATWVATLASTSVGMRTVLPVSVSSLIANNFCRGWRQLQDGTLVLNVSTSECSRLTVAQCLVGKCTRNEQDLSELVHHMQTMPCCRAYLLTQHVDGTLRHVHTMSNISGKNGVCTHLPEALVWQILKCIQSSTR